ncbi:hypothetical protein F4778DRAFT_59416 [Xylariomycetidae sp. FL2044]|nr:hypothetical protein F4778DRAFT_59416 [Xylariomycetidae sp. FL2044]
MTSRNDPINGAPDHPAGSAPSAYPWPIDGHTPSPIGPSSMWSPAAGREPVADDTPRRLLTADDLQPSSWPDPYDHYGMAYGVAYDNYSQPFDLSLDNPFHQLPTTNGSSDEFAHPGPAPLFHPLFAEYNQNTLIGSQSPPDGPSSPTADRSPYTQPSTDGTVRTGTESTTSPASSNGLTGGTRHKRDRERNRLAAHKCRQNAKRNVASLEQRQKDLSQRNRFLADQADVLREEVLDLKNEILRHSNCESEVIQNYINNAARGIGTTSHTT